MQYLSVYVAPSKGRRHSGATVDEMTKTDREYLGT
jgi:hypothetical protein